MSAKELHFVLSDLKVGNHVAIPNKNLLFRFRSHHHVTDF